MAAGSEKERQRIESEIKGNKIKYRGRCSIGKEKKINCIFKDIYEAFMGICEIINCHKYNMIISLMGIYLNNPKSITCQIQ